MSYYGNLASANAYFEAALHSDAWTDSDAADRPKALTEATRIIDNLNYKGVKHAVWLIMYDQSDPYAKKITDAPTRDEVIAADATQELEFPRGQDTTVPTEIEWATYEIAFALIEGFDSEDAIDRISTLRQKYAAVGTTYAPDNASQEYLVYGIPTAQVWRWLLPYLTSSRLLNFSRAN